MNNKCDDVINIDADPDFYYGEIPRPDLMSILDTISTGTDAEVSIADWCIRSGNSYFRQYALDPRRSLGLRLLGTLAGKRLLDYGCGIGSLSVPAARHGALVTLVDNCLPRLQMAAARIKQSDCAVTAYACQSWRSLPEDVTGFDIILVNGVLEWIASTVGATFSSVLAIQLDFLHAMCERLAPGGFIYLAIENRFALQYLMGYPEDHTNIPYLSLMPRDKANEQHRKEKGSDFTVWTWGLDEFYEYLPRVGLAVHKAYAVFPDYRFPKMIADLEDEEALRRGLEMEDYEKSPMRTRLTDYFSATGRLKHIVYSYIFLLDSI
jgi:2-polyprenyl-3-methyl-5-hydroxy-6-metoxy-1,4-benzoquinol methylase